MHALRVSSHTSSREVLDSVYSVPSVGSRFFEFFANVQCERKLTTEGTEITQVHAERESWLLLSHLRAVQHNWEMRSRILVIALCVCSSLAVARAKGAARTGDPQYGSALAAANRFLHAWQTQDHETGIMMLTDAAREHASRDQLQEFFLTGPEAAFEIRRGRRTNEGEYSFPVVLFDASSPTIRPHACRIVIVKTGIDDWAVDRLP